MTDEFWKNLAQIITAIGLLITSIFAVLGHFRSVRADKVQTAIAKVVDVVEKQTNSMNEKMVASAEIKGELTGKIKAETAAAMAAGQFVQPMVANTPLPLVMAPAPSENTATAEEIRKWIAMGMDLGEKARREARGNGPPKAPA